MSLYQEYKNWDDFSSEEKLSKIKAFIENEVVNVESLTREEKAVLKACIPAYVPKEDSTDKYIFISYSHKDAKKVYFDLAYFMYNSKTRVRFWYDEGLKFGENWVKDAGVHLEDKNCVGVLFYLSENLLLSPAVFKEISIVKKLKKFWFSVALDPKITSAKPLKKDSVEVLEKKGITLEKLKTLIKFFPDNNTALVHYSWNSDARIKQLGKYFSVVYEAENNQTINNSQKSKDSKHLSLEEAKSCFEFEDSQELKPIVKPGWYIKKYTGDSINVIIPEDIDGIPVVAISGNILPNHAKTIRIPKTVEYIHAIRYFEDAEVLEYIIVDKDNPEYFDLNGILCDKKQNMVLRAPINWDWQKQFILLEQENYKSASKIFFNYLELLYILDEIYTVYRLSEDKPDSKYINKSVKYLEFENSFNLCCAAQSKNIFNGIKKIGAGAFAHCKRLYCLFLPDSVCSLDYYTFSNSNIELVFLPENISINNKCFYKCYNLKSILAPTLNSGSYKHCYLNQLFNIVYLSGSFKINSSAFEDCDIKEVILSGKEISGRAQIIRANKIEKVILERDVKELSAKCFFDCQSLKEVTIPSTVKYIALDAFEKCNGLQSVNYGGTVAEWDKLWDESARRYFEYSKNYLNELNAGKSELENILGNIDDDDRVYNVDDIKNEIYNIDDNIYKIDNMLKKGYSAGKHNIPAEFHNVTVYCSDGAV